MRLTSFDARYPDESWHPGDGWNAVHRQIPIVATHLAREALALPVQPLDRATLVGAIANGAEHVRAFGTWQIGDDWRGIAALCAALFAEWDLVAALTGKEMLGTRVTAKKTFDRHPHGLARHLATAARARLPPTHVVAAMEVVRGDFASDPSRLDPRGSVIATRLFVRDIVAAEDVVGVTRAWLSGEAIEMHDAAPVRGVADGEDSRATIFERFATELGDEAELRAALASAATITEPWDRSEERARAALDDLVIRAFVARVPLFDGWEHVVDPLVASWLGAAPSAACDRRWADFTLLAGRSMKLDRGWDEAIKALVVGNADAVRALTGAGKLAAFRPGQFFKDDGRKLLRYLASAIASGARVADVEPAWLDFLARRSPATTPRIEGGELRWKHLLAIQHAIASVVGKAPRGEAGLALQRLVTGV